MLIGKQRNNYSRFCLLLLSLTLTCLYSVAAEKPSCLILSNMETPAEWQGPFPAETVKGVNGGKALVFDFGKGGDGEWVSKTFPGRKIDLDDYDLIKFDYRVENGGGYFSVRFQQWPYLGGFMALGHHIDPPFRPREWQTMTFNIHEPENAWGQSYNRDESLMMLSFGNIIADPGKSVRVYVDNIRLIRRQFSVDCNIDDLYLDFGKRQDLTDGSSVYRYALTLRNRTDKDLNVKLHLDTSKLKHFAAKSKKDAWKLSPKDTVQALITVTVPKSAKKGLPIAYSEETLARFTVASDSSSEHTITLLAAVPFKAKPHPYLFATGSQIHG